MTSRFARYIDKTEQLLWVGRVLLDDEYTRRPYARNMRQSFGLDQMTFSA